MQKFWQNGIYSPFWIWPQEAKKKKLKSQKVLTHPMKIWHFGWN
jgi:hypothetical protein